MSRRKYLTNQELLDVMDNWNVNELDYDPSLAIETVIVLPPDNVVGESDDEFIDDDEISTNIACDLSPLNEVAGIICCGFFNCVWLIVFVCLGTIEVIYESNIEDYAGPEEVVEQQPSTSQHEPPAKKYRPKSDFNPNWGKTKRFKYDIHPVHEPLKQTKQTPMLEAIGNVAYI